MPQQLKPTNAKQEDKMLIILANRELQQDPLKKMKSKVHTENSIDYLIQKTRESTVSI